MCGVLWQANSTQTKHTVSTNLQKYQLAFAEARITSYIKQFWVIKKTKMCHIYACRIRMPSSTYSCTVIMYYEVTQIWLNCKEHHMRTQHDCHVAIACSTHIARLSNMSATRLILALGSYLSYLIVVANDVKYSATETICIVALFMKIWYNNQIIFHAHDEVSNDDHNLWGIFRIR